MNHFHLIYTPKGLAELDPNGLAQYSRYLVHQEMGQGGLHYHMYIETEYTQQTVSDKLKDSQNIPKSTAGKRSLHFSNRAVAAHPDKFPDQDLRRFTLGYIQKQGNCLYNKGFDKIELDNALEYYKENKHPGYKDHVLAFKGPPLIATESQGPPLEETKKSESIQDRWIDFSIAMMKTVPYVLSRECEGGTLDKNPNLTYHHFRAQAWNYWKKRNSGLFPPQAEQKRFLQSIWALYLTESNRQIDLDQTKEYLNY